MRDSPRLCVPNTHLCRSSSNTQDDGLALIYIDRWVLSLRAVNDGCIIIFVLGISCMKLLAPKHSRDCKYTLAITYMVS